MSPIVTLLCALGLILVAPVSQALTPPHPTHVLLDLQVLPNADMLLMHSHGVFRRSPTSTTWKHVLEAKDIRRLFVHRNEVYAAAMDELYSSIDYGATWTKRPVHYVDAIGDDGTLYGCTRQGEFASKDQGRSWQLLDISRAAPRTEPFACARRENTATYKQHEYTIDSERLLYYRSGHGERWLNRPVGNYFSADDIFTDLRTDRNGVLYMNVFRQNRRDPHDYLPRKIFLSRDRGERWEELSWDHSRVRPVDPQIWGVSNTTLLMTCEMPGRKYEHYICESSDTDPNALVFRAKVQGDTLIAAPDGALYSLDRYDLKRLGRGEENWQADELEGVPDGFGLPRKKPAPLTPPESAPELTTE